MSFVHTLTFIKKVHETGDIYTFHFSRPKGLKYRAGQHGLFLIPTIHRPHPFSISAAPGEGTITISTHIHGKSRYKRFLAAMKPGSKIAFVGPIMNFTYNDAASHHILLAQGIGITPFRSMLVHAHATKQPAKTTLIHVDRNDHPLKQDTQPLTAEAYYPASQDEFRKLVARQPSTAMFYISGSPAFARATKKLLKQRGVGSRQMKTDSFLGY